MAGHGLRGAVVGWYLPVLVVDEKQMRRAGGVRVVVLMRRVAVGRTAGGVEQAVGIRCRQEWCKHKYEQGAAGGYSRTEGASRWWQRGTGGGAGGLGRMDRTSSGGHRVEERRSRGSGGQGNKQW